jgi:ribosomal protein L29
MKPADVRTKTDQELATLLADNQKQLEQLTLEMRTKQTKNVKQIWALKRTRARALTARRERELKEQPNG